MWILLICLVSLFSVGSANETPSYLGAKVYEIIPETQQHLQVLQDLNSRIEKRGAAEEDEPLSFWKEPHAVGSAVHLLVDEEHDRQVREVLTEAGLKVATMIHDVGHTIQEQKESSRRARRDTDTDKYSYEEYQRYDAIMNRIDSLVKTHSSVVKKTVLTEKTHEGRDLVVLELKTKRAGTKNDVKKIWIDGGIHAREWISPATTMYLLEKLLKTPELLQNTDWYVMPLMNPDGYEYSHTTNRLWRKNRAVNTGSSCRGVDLNRNFDFQFGVSGTSTSPCQEIYGGPEALSEPESRATAEYLRKQLPDLDVYLTLHSYGQEWLAPWGYTSEPVDEDGRRKLADLGNAAVEALRSVHGKVFKYGSAADLTYPASGASDDWSYNRIKDKDRYSYTVELRDQYPRGRHGFLLPEDQIIPSGEEMWAALKCINSKVHGYGC